LRARVSLFADGPATPALARAAELGVRAVVTGDEPLVADAQPLLAISPTTLLVSAIKPAEDGDGVIVRLLNPTDDPTEAAVRFGVPITGADPCALDESPAAHPVRADGDAVQIPVPPYALRSIRVRWA
jgi:alpha-mannosidase